jgi:YfiH family protein
MWRIETTEQLGRIAVPELLPPGTAVFCTTRDFRGRLDPDIAGTIAQTVRARFGIEAVLTTCTQIHSANVSRANAGKDWRECDACDALWSDETHVALGIKVADCLPVAMVDPSHSVIADVHSGWRGAVQGITRATIDAIGRETPFDAPSAYAYLGPSIRVCCFEVGEEVASQFDERYLDRSREKAHVDLAKYTADVLRERGFRDDRISDSGLCTRCEGSIFHSYRRDGANGGRNLTIVAQ